MNNHCHWKPYERKQKSLRSVKSCQEAACLDQSCSRIFESLDLGILNNIRNSNELINDYTDVGLCQIRDWSTIVYFSNSAT